MTQRPTGNREAATARAIDPVRERGGSLHLTPGGFSLGRIAGVRIQVDWSLLIVFALVAFNLGAVVFPAWHPDWDVALTWSVALGAAVLLFASVLVHELSHAVVAQRQGIPVRRITLFLFGGVAHMEREPPSPRAEFLMAIVGPVVSLAIGIIATALGRLIAGPAALDMLAVTERPADTVAAFQQVGPVATLLLWLGPVNIVLGLFNIVPGFPLDGGRVLRSVLWMMMKDLARATRWASAVGQVFAWTLMVFGLLNVFGGAVVQGFWLLLIGWFLNNAARMSYEQVLVRTALAGVTVANVMRTRLEPVPADLPIDRFVREHLMASDQQAFPVEDDGRVLGLVEARDVLTIPQQEWTSTPVGRVMTPTSELRSISPDAEADRALQELATQERDQIPVFDNGNLLGLVRRRDVVKWIALQGGRPGLLERT